MRPLTTGTLAKASGVNLETIRFYERERLLEKPPRTASGYRVFPADAVQRVRFIKRAQALGFTLQEIRELLALSGARNASCESIRSRAESKVEDIEERIQSLKSIKKALLRLTESCSGQGSAAHCPILECLNSDKEESC